MTSLIRVADEDKLSFLPFMHFLILSVLIIRAFNAGQRLFTC